MRRLAAAWLALGCALPSHAFWGEVHGKMHERVLNDGVWPTYSRGTRSVSNVESYLGQVLYLRRPLGRKLWGVHYAIPICWATNFLGCNALIDHPTDEPNASKPVVDWLAEGAIAEDGFQTALGGSLWAGLRAVNHFHTPFNSNGIPEGGFTGFIGPGVNVGVPVPVLGGLHRSGISVVDWANEVPSGGQINFWGWPSAHHSYRRFFTEQTTRNRERGLACAVRAMGQVQHLLQDNAIPDHARDLAHPLAGFEEFVRANLSVLNEDFSQWTEFPAQAIEQQGLRALWDRDVYDGSNPGVTFGGAPPGIDEFTNANFFAFNEGDLLTLSDIPSTPSTGGVFPWPRYPLVDPGQYAPSVNPPALKLDKVVKTANPFLQPVGSDYNRLDAQVWSNYAPPLMQHLLGYSLATWPLLLPPARAEIVPDPTEPMEHARVRLWNLAPAGSLYASTWQIDSVSVLPLLPEGTGANPLAPNDEIAVDFGAGATVAPGGQPVESNSFVITPTQRTNFFYAPYTVVLVTAHLGTTKVTQLEFGVPIPNAYPLLKQADVKDTSAVGMVSKVCSSDPTCGDDTIEGSIHVPFEQQLQMSLELKGPHVDLLGTKLDASDGALLASIQEDVHLAGVGLGAFVTAAGTEPDLSMVRWPGASVFTTAPPAPLQLAATGLYTRPRNAADLADPSPIPLTINLELKDFISADADAVQVSESTYLTVWTTSGAMYLMRLYLWPVYDREDAPTKAMNISCSTSVLAASYVSVGICQIASVSPCMGDTYSFAWEDAPFSGVQGFPGGVGPNAQAGGILGSLGEMGVTSLGSTMVAAADSGKPANLCSANELANFSKTGGQNVCDDGPGAFGYRSVAGQVGTCSPPALQNLARQATFAPLFSANGADAYLWEQVFGMQRADEPSWTLTAH